jgi:hypothetical protein
MTLCRASTGAPPRPNPTGAALLPMRATPPTIADPGTGVSPLLGPPSLRPQVALTSCSSPAALRPIPQAHCFLQRNRLASSAPPSVLCPGP